MKRFLAGTIQISTGIIGTIFMFKGIFDGGFLLGIGYGIGCVVVGLIILAVTGLIHE